MADQNLRINLTAFDRTRTAFASVRVGLNKVKSSIFSVRGALIGLAAGAALKKFATDIDNLAKQSARLGVTVNQLQTLSFAASQSGTGAAELSKGFEKFNKSISEASSGMGTGVKAFEALGITLTNSDGSLKNTDVLLGEVADGFTGIKDPADRVRIAMDLFGRSGAGMVNMLQGGSKNLADMRAEFNRLTIELTGPQAAAVEAANDAFDKMSRTFLSIGQQIAATVLPALAELGRGITASLIDKFATAIGSIRGMINAYVALNNIIADKIPGINKMQESTFGAEYEKKLRKVSSQYSNMTVLVGDVAAVTVTAADGVTRMETSLDKAVEKLKEFSEQSKEVKANLAGVALKGLGTLEDGLLSIIDGTKSAKDAFKDMARSIVNDLLRMAIQRSITGPLAGALGGFFGAPSGGSMGGVIHGSAPTVHAIGGSVQRGRMSVVGERGPELFMPGASGAIVPNNQMGGGGGVVVNQTINLSAGVSQTVRAEVMSMMPQIAEVSKAAVADAKQRGGAYSRAI